ncbi:hypothetical protein FHG87_002399 [Trinorchestia longiramus]|nr:hypothetical protein FHG87_002399 [Trinorchestia longiramus]
MRILLCTTVVALCLVIIQAHPEAKPKPEAKPNLVSVVEKSTTHLPNHFSQQVSAYNVNAASAYPSLYGGSVFPYTIPYYNHLPYSNLGNHYKTSPYLGNYHAEGLGRLSPNFVPYSLAPDGDSSWYYLNSSPLDAYSVNNLLNFQRLYGLTQPYLNPLYSAYGSTRPALYTSNLSALDKFKLNSKLLGSNSIYGRPALLDQSPSSLLSAASIHNAHAIAMSKEVDYKKKDD